MAEEQKSVEPTTGVEQEQIPAVTSDRTSLDTSLTPDSAQDLSRFSLSGVNGITVGERRQAGQGAVLSFVRGEKITQGSEAPRDILQREFGVSEVAIGVETSLRNPSFSSELQQAFVQNPDFLFPYSPLRNLEVIKVRLGESITPSHPELEAVRALAEEYIPQQLPGNVHKHHLRSLGKATEGNVASAIAIDVESVRELAKAHRDGEGNKGPQGIVREDIAKSWEDLKMAARAAA